MQSSHELRAIGALSAVVPERFGGLGPWDRIEGNTGLARASSPHRARESRSGSRLRRPCERDCVDISVWQRRATCKSFARRGRGSSIRNLEYRPGGGLRVVGTCLKGSKIFCSAAGYATRDFESGAKAAGKAGSAIAPPTYSRRSHYRRPRIAQLAPASDADPWRSKVTSTFATRRRFRIGLTPRYRCKRSTANGRQVQILMSMQRRCSRYSTTARLS